MKYMMTDIVSKVEEKVARRWAKGCGKDAEFIDDSQGWWLRLESLPASIYIGHDKPELREGDRVSLKVEKI